LNIKAYPNPTHGVLTIEMNKRSTGTSVELLDVSGRTIEGTQYTLMQIPVIITAIVPALWVLPKEVKTTKFWPLRELKQNRNALTIKQIWEATLNVSLNKRGFCKYNS